MRRGPKPAKSKEAKPPVARQSPKNDGARVRDLEKRLAEALEQQAAAADILRLIAESPSDLPAVLDGILSGAIRLLGAEWGAMSRFDGELFHLVAQHGATPGFLETAPSFYPFAPDPDSPSTQAITERHPVYIADAFEASYRGTRELARAGPFRSLLTLPLLREGRGIGTINLTWADVRPFPADRIEVLKTFADQAVIAIENVRLFNETKEALEQQTATSDILRVISCSPTDVQPVFDTIVRSAVTLCHAAFGGLHRVEGDINTLAALYNLPADEAALVRGLFPRPIDRASISGRAMVERRVVHIHDIREDREYNAAVRDPQAARGYRTVVSVPMLREGVPIGAINLWHREVQPFTDKQIALLQTFADQAVIAIENVRLFNETKEALDRQTATSEILRVISQSPTDVQPVFDAIARSARRLCEATQAVVSRYDGELVHLAALDHVSPEGLELARQVFPMPPSRATTHGRVVLDRTVVHMADVRADAEYSASLARAIQNRSTLGVPMLLDGRVIGVIAAARNEVRPFTEAQIELVKTFADQAVIAIENVRLFKELQEKNQALTRAHAQVTESLEQQTATSEILRVISQSPTDVQPVFDVVAESAARLCES